VKAAAAGAARRYARALLDVAAQKDDPARLREELRAAVALLQGNRELSAALAHPGLGSERRRRLALAIFEGKSSPLFSRLLALLAERGRTGLLSEIERAYAAAWNAQRGAVSAQAVSALPLDAAQQDGLKSAIRGATGREVELETQVDASLIGGVLVTMDGRTYDGSVRRQLARLREALAGGGSGA
jgi:F-type H+-transporting ATPase subunit delta